MRRKRFKDLFLENKRPQHNVTVLSLSYGRIIAKDMEAKKGVSPDSFAAYQGVLPQDIVMRLTDLQNDQKSIRVAQSSLDGIITSAYLSVSTGKDLDAGFAYYLLHDMADIQKVCYSLGGGVRQTIKFADFADLEINLLPIDIQRRGSVFLDRQTSIIDEKIALISRKQGLLAELRKSTIHEAVTKGLDKAVLMKISTVNWIGEIPQEWELVRVGTIFEEVSLRGSSTGDVLTVSIAHGIMPQSSFEELTGRRLSKPINDKDNYRKVEIGDFVYNKMRMWQGAVGISTYNGVVSPAYVVFRAKKKANAKFLLHLMKSDVFISQSNSCSYGIVDDQNSLKFSNFKAMTLAYPPLDEQEAIANFLERETSIIDQNLALLARQKELLQEQRKALIHEVVTGKMRVI